MKIIELFAGLGSQTQALKNIGIKHEVTAISEIDRFALTSYEALHGKPNNLGDITKIAELPAADLWTYSFPCFTADTLILTAKGYRRIADIVPGDKVLTHKNRYREVTAIYNQGDKAIVKINGMVFDEIRCTPNHRFYVRERYHKYPAKKPRYKRLFKQPEWREAKDLSKNYFLGYAINQNSTVPNWDGISFSWNDGRRDRHKNEIAPLVSNKNFWWVIGRYIGDGWQRYQGGIIICGDFDEESEIVQKLNGQFNYSIVYNRTTVNFHIAQKEIQAFVAQFEKGSGSLRLTDTVLNLPVDLLESFLEGYMSADGCYTNGQFKATSISRELIYGIGQCVAKVYKRPFSIYKCKRPPTCEIEGRTVNQKNTYSITFKKTTDKQDTSFYEDGYIWFPLTSIKNSGVETVYDISVDEDESFTANGAIAHNCQDISLAGKQAGIKEGTRSGLLFEVERLLKTAAEKDTLPKYLLLENVKPLVGAKFKPDFDKWVAFLSSLGYKSYWQVLNTRNYCIPQNRERVFCVSIRGDHEPYRFPEKRELRLRLKDMLDAEVEGKYYLSERSLQSLLNATFNVERGRMQDLNGVHRTVCARDHKSPTVVPECRQAGTLTGEKWDKMHDISRRVYDSSGVSPCLHCAMGGNTQIKVIDDTYKSREPRIYEDVVPSIRSEQRNFKVIAGQFQPINRDYKEDGEPRAEHFECRNDEVANAVLTGDRKNCVKIVAVRGRQDEPGGEYIQRLEPNEEGVTNALTSVLKDNLLLEPQVLMTQRTEYGKATRKAYEAHEIPGDRKAMREQVPRDDGLANTLTTVQRDNIVVEPETFVGRAYSRFVNKKGYVPEMFNAYNRAEIQDEAPTLTTQCGSPTASGSILKAETDEVSKCIRVGGHGVHKNHTWNVIEEARKESEFNAVRIRKLTPWECLRLQGWRDAEIAKIRAAGISNAQAYRQAGNGITTTVLMAIFGELFGVEYKHLLDNWRY